MKNRLVYILCFLFFSCTNPSMEDGFSKLNNSLAELAKAIESLNIPKLQEDLVLINEEASQILLDLEDAEKSWQQSLLLIDEINIMLDQIILDVQNWPTSEQMQDLLTDIEEFGEGVDQLVLRADYDYDGVVNGLDRCPDTPLTKINQVDVWGC